MTLVSNVEVSSMKAEKKHWINSEEATGKLRKSSSSERLGVAARFIHRFVL